MICSTDGVFNIAKHSVHPLELFDLNTVRTASCDNSLMINASILYAKSILDGFASMAFASSLGVGVLFSALTVFIYQGLLTLLGAELSFLLRPSILDEMSATGGLMIVGIGFYLLGIKRIKVANFLPALVFAVVLALIFK